MKKDENPIARPIKEDNAIEFGIWLNKNDYQSTPHANKMRSVRYNDGKPTSIEELYAEYIKQNQKNTD
jgi:hypothetical protein